MIGVLRNKNYNLLLFGRGISSFGDIINGIAFMWYVLTVADSYIIAALSLVINYIPKIIFSGFSGVLADKYSNKKIIVICDYANGCLAIFLAILIFFKSPVSVMFVITFLMSVCDTFFQISCDTLYPKIVSKDTLLEANSLKTGILKTIGLIGPIVGGALYFAVSPALIFFINGLTFIISAISESFITEDITKINVITEEDIKPQEKRNVFQEIIYGYKRVKDFKFIFIAYVIGGSIINFLLAPLSLYMPVYVKDLLKMPSWFYGTLVTAIPAGNIACSLIFLKLKKLNMNKRLLVCVGFIFEGVSYILFGLSGNYILAYLSLVCFGISLSLAGINLSTIIQEDIPIDVYGRISGALNIILGITIPLGYIIGGCLLPIIDLYKILLISGVIIAACGAFSLRYKNLVSASKLDQSLISTSINEG